MFQTEPSSRTRRLAPQIRDLWRDHGFVCGGPRIFGLNRSSGVTMFGRVARIKPGVQWPSVGPGDLTSGPRRDHHRFLRARAGAGRKRWLAVVENAAQPVRRYPSDVRPDAAGHGDPGSSCARSSARPIFGYIDIVECHDGRVRGAGSISYRAARRRPCPDGALVVSRLKGRAHLWMAEAVGTALGNVHRRSSSSPIPIVHFERAFWSFGDSTIDIEMHRPGPPSWSCRWRSCILLIAPDRSSCCRLSGASSCNPEARARSPCPLLKDVEQIAEARSAMPRRTSSTST